MIAVLFCLSIEEKKRFTAGGGKCVRRLSFVLPIHRRRNKPYRLFCVCLSRPFGCAACLARFGSLDRYSSSCELVLAVQGQGVHGFTLDAHVGEFILTRPYIKIPKVKGGWYLPPAVGGIIEARRDRRFVAWSRRTMSATCVFCLCFAFCGCRVLSVRFCVPVCGVSARRWHATHGQAFELLGSLDGALGDPPAAARQHLAGRSPPPPRVNAACPRVSLLTGATLAVVTLRDVCHRR